MAVWKHHVHSVLQLTNSGLFAVNSLIEIQTFLFARKVGVSAGAKKTCGGPWPHLPPVESPLKMTSKYKKYDIDKYEL